jgi:hypothetical protein
MIFLLFILPPMVLLCLSSAVALRVTFTGNPGIKTFSFAALLNFGLALAMYSFVMAVIGHEFYVGQKGGEWAFYLKGVFTWSTWSTSFWLPLMVVFAFVSWKWR